LQGHTLIPIPNRLCTPVPDVDLLLITGGDDHPVRNQIEHELTNSMLSRNLSIIGVCHGCQFLTTKLGGTVVPVEDHQDCYHEVEYHGAQHLVNSYHKLRIEQTPPGATVLARDPDGYVEAWILGRTAGVMCHPERMAQPWIPNEIQQLLTR
jgi:gamma-glutamyl-gamma-aminobutyrate hydrolase PuuD